MVPVSPTDPLPALPAAPCVPAGPVTPISFVHAANIVRSEAREMIFFMVNRLIGPGKSTGEGIAKVGIADRSICGIIEPGGECVSARGYDCLHVYGIACRITNTCGRKVSELVLQGVLI